MLTHKSYIQDFHLIPSFNLCFMNVEGRKKFYLMTHSTHFIYSYMASGARCSSVVRAFAHGVMGRRIDPSWGGPIELFLVPASAPRLV